MLFVVRPDQSARTIKKPAVAGGLDRLIAERAYFFVLLRLNFEVNFSTRPAVSTRRFSPV
jgi:hypothetical protein